MSKRKNRRFGSLLKAGLMAVVHIEDSSSAILESDLGEHLGLSPASIQSYKAGAIPSEETVAYLAEVCVQRGNLNGKWLRRFLESVGYPLVERRRLVERLCPEEAFESGSSMIHNNLPPQSYSTFIPRPGSFAKLHDALDKGLPIIIVDGLPGTGKSTLVHHLVSQVCQRLLPGANFSGVVWFSDKERQGLTLNRFLDEIARTFDLIDPMQPVAERPWAIAQLLRKEPTLLILDDFNPASDPALVAFLHGLPSPSRAIITSTESMRELKDSAIFVSVPVMTDDEAREFVEQRLQWLRLSHRQLLDQEMTQLLAATDCNPKIIQLALGQYKQIGVSLPEILAEFAQAGGPTPIIENLFRRSWEQLNNLENRLLLIAALAERGITQEALATIAQVPNQAACKLRLSRGSWPLLVKAARAFCRMWLCDAEPL